MPPKTLILVLIVREAGLRSTLAARLSMAGVDVITADNFDDPRLDRLREPPVLVVDMPSVAGRAGGLAGLLADPRWHSLVLVGEHGTGEDADEPRLLRIDRANVGAAIDAKLPCWQA